MQPGLSNVPLSLLVEVSVHPSLNFFMFLKPSTKVEINLSIKNCEKCSSFIVFFIKLFWLTLGLNNKVVGSNCCFNRPLFLDFIMENGGGVPRKEFQCTSCSTSTLLSPTFLNGGVFCKFMKNSAIYSFHLSLIPFYEINLN